jgi:hypothetical protein
MAKRMGLVVVSAMALAAPGAAQARVGDTSSCGYGQGGSGHTAYTEPPQSAGCTVGSSNATAAQAAIRISGLREHDIRSEQQVHDADGSHSNTAGDYFTGRIDLIKGGKTYGSVKIKSTIVSLNGSVAQLHDEYTMTVKKQGNKRGGHLSGAYDHTEDFNAAAKVGDVDHLPITSSDGRFEGYTGEVISRVAKVAKNGEPTFVDTISLHRAAAS